MQINHLELKNFRCFQKAEFDFHPQLNFIVGDELKQTDLLEALSIAAGSWLLGLKEKYDTRQIQNDDVFHDLQNNPQYPCTISVVGEILGQNISWQRDKKSATSSTTRKLATQIHQLSVEADNRLRSGEFISLPLISYYGVQPLNKHFKYTLRPRRRLLGYENSVNPFIHKSLLLNWFFKKTHANFKSPHNDFVLVKQTVLSLLPNCSDIQYNFDLDDWCEKDIVFVIDSEKVSFEHLSNEYQYLFFLTLDIAYKAAILNYSDLHENTLIDTKGVILIDKFDIHVSKEHQVKFIQSLIDVFPKMQFMITAQSNLIDYVKCGKLLSI